MHIKTIFRVTMYSRNKCKLMHLREFLSKQNIFIVDHFNFKRKIFVYFEMCYLFTAICLNFSVIEYGRHFLQFQSSGLKILDHFFALKNRFGPHMNRWKQFRELLRFGKDIPSQSSKIACLQSQWQRRHANFYLDRNIFLFWTSCYWVCKHTQEPFFTWLFL